MADLSSTGDGSDIDIGPFEFDPIPLQIQDYILSERDTQNYQNEYDLNQDIKVL